MRSGILTLLLFLLMALQPSVYGQNTKVWASGAARSIFQQDQYISDGDTITPGKLNSGHALVDLAVNAKPNDQTFLHAMVRIRNDFGGFWGSGVTFDMRQLYLKGLIRKAIRYQLGDMNYKLSPYTFYNHQEELTNHQSEAMNIYRELTHYDLFYTNDNTWRQQGAAVDFTVLLPRAFEELQMNIFGFRNRPTDFGNQNDRIFWGGNASLVQSKYLKLGMNYVDLMDIAGTSRNPQAFHNPVITGTTELKKDWKDLKLAFHSENGISEMYMLNDPASKTLRDFFMDYRFSVNMKKRSNATLSYINVGPQFRSVGAQTKRVNFEAQNLLYPRIGNEQQMRPITQMDLLQDASLYRLSLNPGLQTFAPQYDNVMPYGTATPNRKGLGLELNHQTKNQFITAGASYRALSEVVGQGTESLRSFGVFQVEALFDFDTLLASWNNALELSASYSGQQTQRELSLSEANINLRSDVLHLGFKIGVLDEMDVIINYRMINASGNELVPVRNDYGQVVDFRPFNTDMKQQHVMLAMRYHFNDKNKLNLVWQELRFNDKNLQTPEFSMRQLGIVYSMFF